MKRLLSPLFAALVLVAAPALTAQVAVTWATPTTVTGPSDVQSNGTFVAALTAAAAPQTVNGITFATASPLITLSNASTITYTPGQFSSGDAAYDAIINRGFYSPVNMLSSLTFNDLTIGHEYQLQIWTPAWDANFATRIYGDTAIDMGNTQTQPTFVIGTFTASGTSERIDFGGYDGATRGLVAAVTLHNLSAVPEPSTYALFAGLAVFGLAVWRRNHTNHAMHIR
jgi:hypothetical protein